MHKDRKITENDCFLNGNRIPLKTEFDADLRVEKTITVYYTVTKALWIVAPLKCGAEDRP